MPTNIIDFTGAFAPANWTFDNGGGDGSASFNTPNNTELTLTGNDLDIGPIDTKEYRPSYNFSVGFTLSFSWNYTTNDTSAFYDPFFYTINGYFYNQLSEDSGGSTQSGTVSQHYAYGNYIIGFAINGGGGGAATVTISNFQILFDNIPCLTENTTVLTESGYAPITSLKEGDFVLTSDNRSVPIVKLLTTREVGGNKTYPYIVPASSLSENYPPKEVVLSRNHLIKHGDEWVHPHKSKLFKQDKSKQVIDYYHIQLPNYVTDHLVINDGCVVESLGDENLDEYNQRISQKNKK